MTQSPPRAPFRSAWESAQRSCKPAIRGSDPGTATLDLDGPEKSIDPTAHNIFGQRPTNGRSHPATA